MDIAPQPGKQTAFLQSNADIAIFGGSSGSGKTFGLLLEPLRHIHNPDFGCVIFRRESKQILNEGGLRDEALLLYPHCGAVYRAQPTPMFIFPSGSRVSFGHLNQEQEVLAWHGSQIALIGFDELCMFTQYQFFYMLSRNRSVCGIKPYVRATCNPDSDSWVAEFLSWWIDQETGYPIEERSGVLRYMIRVDGNIVWGNTVQELVENYGCETEDPKSVTFIPAKITDNPILLSKDPGYISNLKALSFVERSRLLDGNWKVRPAGGMYFPRFDATLIDWLPTDVTRWVRSWDLAASEVTDGTDPDWTVGILIGRRSSGRIVIGDMVRIRRKAAEVRQLVLRTAQRDGKETMICLPQDPGQSGRAQLDSYREYLSGYSVASRYITKNKLLMAEPFAAAWQQGNVEVVRGRWNEDLLQELEVFPDGKHDDCVDACSAALSRLPSISSANYGNGGLSGRFRTSSLWPTHKN